MAGPLRRAARILGALAVVVVGVPMALAARLAGTAQRTRFTMLWSRMLVRALGIRIEARRGFAFVGGSLEARAVPEGEGGALLVGNHISWLDPLLMAAITPCRLLSKIEISRWPVIRTLAAGGNVLFIDRNRLSALPEAIDAVAAALRDGDTVVAFPEGTTWCGREMGTFRPAVFQAAIDAGVPVRPMALRFRQGEVPSTGPCYVGDDALIASIMRVIAIKDLVAEVTFFPGVQVPRGGDPRHARKTLARIAEAQVRAGVVETHREAVAA
ncbi:1-acyl-sn-glycerol-3-phosphate acyltransferase [Planotetraspora thailandica]|uniref:1-acyl-sn-glycerol-3-phosphate acyltransferase n=1 Tax=Planotetraspora thailandica TaxID=487172 RepID=A0A8J3VB71_9ACTN|nr:1-acyl-sn-glycerol-3-phosphate acyltransferase [Planotetraspora thailandica]